MGRDVIQAGAITPTLRPPLLTQITRSSPTGLSGGYIIIASFKRVKKVYSKPTQAPLNQQLIENSAQQSTNNVDVLRCRCIKHLALVSLATQAKDTEKKTTEDRLKAYNCGSY